jgi:UDP-GlcNAc:undecaprenyl-phosphate GlcNAc-1-phosphate transferase
MFSDFINLDYKTKQIVIISSSLLLSVIIAYIATPFAIKFANKIGAVDVPTDERRMHKKPIPLLGGLAIIVAFIITSIVMMRYHRLLWEILPGALLIVLLGVIDDKKRLPAWPKLFVQCIAAVLPILVNKKIIIDSISGIHIFGLYRISFGIFSIPITILWIVGVTNAVNLVDGLDGLAAGISTIASISMLMIAVIKMSHDANEYGIAILAAALAGGCLGLLPYNRNPAKVFMGDTGATFLGYTLAIISIQGLFKAYAAISFAVPLLILGLPLIDTVVAIIRRLHDHKSPFTPDRSHIHHKLIDLGLDQKQAVGLLYAVAAIMGIVAVLFAAYGSSTGWLFFFAALALITLICILAIPLCRKHNDTDESRDVDADKNVVIIENIEDTSGSEDSPTRSGEQSQTSCEEETGDIHQTNDGDGGSTNQIK